MTPLQTLITNFHFLRPLWLLAVLPGAGLFYALWRRHGQGGQWQKVIDAALLPFLMGRDLADNRSHRPLTALLAAWLLASVSLAGPTWEKLPQPVHKKQDALVLIQDLSLSLYAQDLAPDRLTRARHKLMDILAARTEGTTALIVYAGDAHVVCPLTDDTRTIAAMLPALSPELMPRYGSNIEEAVELALQLL
ncbi:MAG: VWA domain-containing protein, partial [Desulfobulbaceae bacterium]|nr:VWA domain-containing protein [Desulfobulbaceae bacterium]